MQPTKPAAALNAKKMSKILEALSQMQAAETHPVESNQLAPAPTSFLDTKSTVANVIKPVEDPTSNGVSMGAIIGGVIGVLFLCMLVIGLIVKKRRSKKEEQRRASLYRQQHNKAVLRDLGNKPIVNRTPPKLQVVDRPMPAFAPNQFKKEGKPSLPVDSFVIVEGPNYS